MAALREIFITNLKYYRKEKKITQAGLALAIDKSFNYINSIENGTFFPPPETIEAIADALKIKPVQLFDENSSLDTILLGDRNKIVDDLSETLYVKLKADIHRDIENALKKR
jgi:transcriptional regulator with XRE-family HTH domain